MVIINSRHKRVHFTITLKKGYRLFQLQRNAEMGKCHLSNLPTAYRLRNTALLLQLLLHNNVCYLTVFLTGSPPTVSEWLIFIFVMGRFLAQVSAMNKRGLKDYLQDTWNLNHLIQLVLFFSSFITR